MTEKEALELNSITTHELLLSKMKLKKALLENNIVLACDVENKLENHAYYMTDSERTTHMHIMGRSGGGKSRLIEFMVRQDIQRGRGVCVIDPHGELYWNIVRYIIQECDNDIKERVYLLNPSQDDYLIQFNPFFIDDLEGLEAHTDKILGAIEKIWKKDLTENPGIYRYLTMIIQTSIIQRLGVMEILESLFSHNKRKKIFSDLQKNKHNISLEVFEFWREIVANPNKSEMILSGAHTRLRLLLSSPAIQMMTLKGTSLDITQVINNNGIILVNLAKTKTFSLKHQKIVGTLLLNELVNFFDNRGESFKYAGDPNIKTNWSPFFLYVDEFQRYITSDLGEILAGGRKFGFHMIMANQTFSQLDEKLKEEISNIASAKAYFAVKDINIAMEIWKQAGTYSPKIKEVVTRLQVLDDGYDYEPTTTSSTNHLGQVSESKSERVLKRNKIVETKENKYYSEQETALIEGKKIQQLKPRHFLFTSDNMPEGIILKTEWCFDTQCFTEEINDFHKYLAEKHPGLYYSVTELKKELELIKNPFSEKYIEDQKAFEKDLENEEADEDYN